MTTTDRELIYVWDAYCGWCYGFSKTIRSLHENHPELPLTVLSGGLFVGDRSLSMKSYPHIPEANQRISQMTGVEFGTAYQERLKEGSFVMDSVSAAIGFNALRSLAPDDAVYLASAMQHAFYYEGMSLSELETYKKIALDNNIDPDAVTGLWNDPAAKAKVQAEFNTVHQLGVNSYPSLLLRNGNELISIGGTMSIDEIEARLARTITVDSPEAEFCSIDNKEGC